MNPNHDIWTRKGSSEKGGGELKAAYDWLERNSYMSKNRPQGKELRTRLVLYAHYYMLCSSDPTAVLSTAKLPTQPSIEKAIFPVSSMFMRSSSHPLSFASGDCSLLGLGGKHREIPVV